MESSNVIGDVHSPVEQNAAVKKSAAAPLATASRNLKPSLTLSQGLTRQPVPFSLTNAILISSTFFAGQRKERTIQSMPRRGRGVFL
jgi:hypothetical protein